MASRRAGATSRVRSLSAGTVVAGLLVTLFVALPAGPSAAATTTYTGTDDTFANPDRGFYTRVDVLNDRDFSRARTATNVLHSYVRLDGYRTSAIPDSFLDTLRSGLAAVRNSGMKIILRFSYNFGPYPNSEPDTTEGWITSHLAQLKPVLTDNADVIMAMEAGFIGAWGEWHTSTSGLEFDSQAKIDIRNAILDALPSTRQVALRYPSDVRLVNGGAIPASEAWNGSYSSRTGNHQDCFLASTPDDWGTWGRNGGSVDADKQLIADNSRYAVTGGETCNSDSSSRVSCVNARDELSRFHFSYLNEDFEYGALNIFRNQGCFDEFKRRLGYRFALRSATYPSSIGRGGTLDLSATITNTGYASPFNQRPVFAVLDGPGGRRTFPVSADPRRWAAGTDTTVDTSFTVPSDLAAGTYTLALWLPDRYPNLRSTASYSIRFANQDVWDAGAGHNVLTRSLTVT